MTQVVFFEKPGCINNTRQKKLLREAGHNVIAINLLQHDWQADELKEYFAGLSVPDWFNQSAPAIKQGEVEPDKLSEQQALSLMMADPILIRRPLIKANGEYRVGFDYAEIHTWIGLDNTTIQGDLESCPRDQHSAIQT